MALVLKDRVKESTSTSGTGTVVLSGASPGYQSFAVIGNGNQTYYTIAGGTAWEVGIGTYYSGNVSLSRDTILASSNSNAAVVLSGTNDVFVTYPAEESVYLNGADLNAGGLSNISFSALTANIASFNNVTITNGTISAQPNAATDIVNKTYVDALVASGVHFHQPVRLEAPTALVAIYNQPNGAGNGVGATLTNSGTQVTLSVDGVAAANTNRILVYNQANAVQNGVYVVSDIGSNATNWVLTRSADTDTYGFDSPNALSEGSTFYVQEGNTGAGETYTCNTPGVITFGTTNITFSQISSAQIYSAGTGLSLNNTTFSISNTAVTAGTYGNAGNVAVVTVNAQGQLTNVISTPIVVSNSAITGLGTMSIQNANDVAITGGAINGTLIGNATASSGAFTTLSASSNVSGVGFANYLNSPPSIGGVTPDTGAFTTLQGTNVTATSNFIGNGAAISSINGANVSTGINASNVTTGTLAVTQGGTGLGNLAAGSVVLGNNTSQVVMLAPGAAGNVLTSDGTQWISNAASGGGGGNPFAENSNSSIFVNNVDITGNVTIAVGQNGLTVSPIGIPIDQSIYVAAGQKLVII